MNRPAQAAQLARILAHAGELLTFGAVSFPASFEPVPPPVTASDRNVGDDTTVQILAPRSVFGATLPRQGQHFTDGAGKLYRIESLPPVPPSHPLVRFVCAVS